MIIEVQITWLDEGWWRCVCGFFTPKVSYGRLCWELLTPILALQSIILGNV